MKCGCYTAQRQKTYFYKSFVYDSCYCNRISGIQCNIFVFQSDCKHKLHIPTSDCYLFDKLASTVQVNLCYQKLNCWEHGCTPLIPFGLESSRSHVACKVHEQYQFNETQVNVFIASTSPHSKDRSRMEVRNVQQNECSFRQLWPI